MPLSGWNGKYQAVGNGAFSGSVRHGSMAAALANGYATNLTDTGHVGNTAEFGLDHPLRHLPADRCGRLLAAPIPGPEGPVDVVEAYDARLDPVVFAVVGTEPLGEQLLPAVGIRGCAG